MVKWTDRFSGGLFEFNHVHIWRASLEYNQSKVNFLTGSLSMDEIERANRFYFESDRMQFIVRRGILRQIISKYLEIDAKNLLFEYNSFGKPFLITDSLKQDFKFNMTHSKNMALYCISSQKNVGVDIEYLYKEFEFQPIIDRFFSQNEKKFIENIAIDKQKEGFFKIWTRKEAILKALGKGISFPLEKIDVSFNEDNFKILINDDGQFKESSWFIEDLIPTKDYVASVAIEGSDSGLIFSHLTY